MVVKSSSDSHVSPKWLTLRDGAPSAAADVATQAEAAGWDGLAVADSQNVSGDCYVALGVAAAVSETMAVGTAVTNPVTRHPAVTACAIQSVHVVSGGRAFLAIGRGDSALAHLGRAPAPPKVLDRYLLAVQAYLRGDDVDFGVIGPHIPMEIAGPVEALGLAGAPDSSCLAVVDHSLPKVPVEVAAAGPRVLRLAARSADRVMLAVGSDPDRIRWAMDTVRRESEGVKIGMYVNAVAHDNVAEAQRIVSGGASVFARFSAMHGSAAPSGDDVSDAVLSDVQRHYDMRAHTQAESNQAKVLTPEFIDRFAVAGTPEYCVDRLSSLTEFGIDKFVILGPVGAPPGDAREATERFEMEVLPKLPR